MKLSHALLGLGAVVLLSRVGSSAPISPPMVTVNQEAVKAATIANFIPDSSRTLSPEGQLHNALQYARGLAMRQERDANILLNNLGALRTRLRNNMGTAYLSASQVRQLGALAGVS